MLKDRMQAEIMVKHPDFYSPSGGPRASLPCPILMLVYNGWEHVIAGLSAMQTVTHHLWLIDNGSTVDRIEEVRKAFPKIRVISTGANLGWAGGYNRAIRIAAAEGYEAVYLLNSDAILRTDAVEQAVATLHGNADVAAVGSMMLHHNGKQVLFDGDWDWHAPPITESLREDVREVRTIHGGGFALRMEAYRAVGPFHEEYFLYHEEVDWCLRAKAAGWRLLVNCRSRVDHEGEGSSTGPNRLYYIARNRFLAMRRGIELRNRKESRISIIEDEYLNAIPLSNVERAAITNGIIDGILGRFGPRGTPYLKIVTRPLTLILLMLVRLKRKIETITPVRLSGAP